MKRKDIEKQLMKLAEKLMDINSEPELKIITTKIAYLLQIYLILY